MPPGQDGITYPQPIKLLYADNAVWLTADHADGIFRYVDDFYQFSPLLYELFQLTLYSLGIYLLFLPLGFYFWVIEAPPTGVSQKSGSAPESSDDP